MTEEKKPFDKISYNNEFNRRAYDRLYILVDKGEKDRLKALAEKKGLSLNEYIKQAISAQICRDTEE